MFLLHNNSIMILINIRSIFKNQKKKKKNDLLKISYVLYVLKKNEKDFLRR